VRWAVALVAGVAILAGCASPLFPQAWLDAHDAAKIGESVAVRFELTNAHPTEDLKVHRHEFQLQGGTGLYTCTNRAADWAILDDKDNSENADVGSSESLEGYLEFSLCPDVAGPYRLIWTGNERREGATDAVDVRSLDSDSPLDAIAMLAHSLNESARIR